MIDVGNGFNNKRKKIHGKKKLNYFKIVLVLVGIFVLGVLLGRLFSNISYLQYKMADASDSELRYRGYSRFISQDLNSKGVYNQNFNVNIQLLGLEPANPNYDFYGNKIDSIGDFDMVYVVGKMYNRNTVKINCNLSLFLTVILDNVNSSVENTIVFEDNQTISLDAKSYDFFGFLVQLPFGQHDISVSYECNHIAS